MLTIWCSSPGCCYLIFHFVCSQPSVYCMHNFIPLISTSSAIKASHNDLLSASKVRSPVDLEGTIHFLTTGSCIPEWKVPQNSDVYSPSISSHRAFEMQSLLITSNHYRRVNLQIKLSKQEKLYWLNPSCCFAWTIKAICCWKVSAAKEGSRLGFVWLLFLVRNFILTSSSIPETQTKFFLLFLWW